MGCGASASPHTDALPKPEQAGRDPVDEQKKESTKEPDHTEFSLEGLGVEVPCIPGDVACCGKLSVEAAVALAPRFKSWLNLNSAEDFFPEDLRNAGLENIEICPFPGPPAMPSEEQAAKALEAIERLPRPMMLQCSSGNRVGVLLLLWLAKKRGRSPESAKQLAVDADLKFWSRCDKCGPMREWVMQQLPAFDAAPVLRPHATDGLIFSQLFDPTSSTYSYLLGCGETKECVLIDPVLEQKDRDLAKVREQGLTLRYVINTHCHADHITSGGMIKKELPDVKTVISRASGAKADILVDGQDKVAFGRFELEAIPTPGHTDGCVTWWLPGLPGMIFTGDAVLIRGCGRTDFQQGDAGRLYDSVHDRLFTLPGDTVLYPGHDYKGQNHSTVDEERKFNPRLTKTRDEFIKLMAELNLPYPKQIDRAVPANMVCGVQDE
mmetsp:Transcript_3565/g.9959  ORF Transcript_3565/g.9959 Transcript_3565/m.9959 type:complete len:437 (+) Transcript_3565:60-1370(+)